MSNQVGWLKFGFNTSFNVTDPENLLGAVVGINFNIVDGKIAGQH